MSLIGYSRRVLPDAQVALERHNFTIGRLPAIQQRCTNLPE